MQFQKDDILKMGGTAIITYILLMIIPYFSTSGSRRISWQEAQGLMQAYEQGRHLETREDGQQVPLKGFRFKSDHIRDIVNPGFLGLGNRPDDIMFYLGQSGDPAAPEYHLIAVGVEQGVLNIPRDRSKWADSKSSNVYDHADPCPPGNNCPSLPQGTGNCFE